ncbi:hypothetical protein AAC387_Pa05g0549 [Persea americana]
MIISFSKDAFCQHMLGPCGRKGTNAYFKALNCISQTVLQEVVNQVRSRVNFLNLKVSKQLGSSMAKTSASIDSIQPTCLENIAKITPSRLRSTANIRRDQAWTLWKERNKNAYFKALNRPSQTVLQEVVNQVRSRVNFLNLKVLKQLGSSMAKTSAPIDSIQPTCLENIAKITPSRLRSTPNIRRDQASP